MVFGKGALFIWQYPRRKSATRAGRWTLLQDWTTIPG